MKIKESCSYTAARKLEIQGKGKVEKRKYKSRFL